MSPAVESFWKEVFRPDAGTLLEIRAYGTSERDQRSLLRFAATKHSAVYVRDGEEQPIPDYAIVVQENQSLSVHVKFYTAGVRVNIWFGRDEEINLDVLPDDVDSSAKARAIFELMKEVAVLLNKRVLLTAENVSATQDWSEEHAICSIDPTQSSVTYHAI